MQKRLLTYLAVVPAAAAPMAAATTNNGTGTSDRKQPNIVMFFVDDMGWADMGLRNPEYETPNLDRLMKEGLDFSRAYVSTATSSPSRASILTGKEALRCGFVRHIYGNSKGAEFESFANDPGHMLSRAWLPLEEITYAERLKEYGYYNCFVGKWHLGPEEYFPIHQGFDEMRGTCEHGHPASYYQPFFKTHNPFHDIESGEYLTDKVTDEAVDFINNYNGEKPFLLNIWHYAVHSPHIGKKELVGKYRQKGIEGDRAEYAAMIEAMDNSLGAVRKALRNRNLDGNTIIFFISDQGGQFRNGHLRGGKLGGYTLCEGGSRVPMVIYAPGMKAMGSTFREPVQTIDIYPTMIELASGKKCTDTQINGVSLTPALDGKKMAGRDLFLFRSYEDQNSAIIRGNWKLIWYRSGKAELYNLKNDESETTDVSGKYPGRTARMLKSLHKWMAEATPAYLLPHPDL